MQPTQFEFVVNLTTGTATGEGTDSLILIEDVLGGGARRQHRHVPLTGERGRQAGVHVGAGTSRERRETEGG